MPSYLIDTNVVSENCKPQPNPTVIAWLESVPAEQCCLSVLTLAELRRGIVLLEAKRATAKAVRLNHWLADTVAQYAGRILDVTPAIAEAWACLPAKRTLPWLDSFIAATAITHGLALVTRNTKDFEGADVSCFDPFELR
ncbi:MAG: type II toxin-antitoxin system VapC family toxin [Propionibacteriaceae bacterium]|jgi:predicted nucleic acid-binding protein|nr:type II toxin-antitoxin system VapC family toxin [Propionibacteriaceae bacterium]